MDSSDALEVISLDSMDMEEAGLEGWTVVDEDDEQQNDVTASRPGSSGREAMESISSPEDFSFEEEPTPAAEPAHDVSNQGLPFATSTEVKQEGAVNKGNQDSQGNEAECVGRAGASGEAMETDSVPTVGQEEVQPVSASEMDASPSEIIGAAKVAEKATLSTAEESIIAEDETKEKRADGNTAADTEGSQTAGETSAAAEGSLPANSNEVILSQDTTAPTQSSKLPEPAATPEQSVLDSKTAESGTESSKSKPADSAANKSAGNKTTEKPKSSETPAEERESKAEEGPDAGDKAGQADSGPEVSRKARGARASMRTSSEQQEAAAARAGERKESREDGKKTRSPRGSRSSSAKGREGKENQGQGESKGTRPGELLKRRLHRPLQSLTVDGQDPTDSQYENLEVLGQGKAGTSTWELQLLKLTMSDLKDAALEKLCSMATNSHWFSMQEGQGPTKYGMMSLLFDSLDLVKAAMSHLFQMEPAEKLQRIALLRTIDGAYPVKTARISCVLDFEMCDRIASIIDNSPSISFSAPSKAEMLSEMYLQLGGLSLELPKLLLLEMLQVIFPKAVHIYVEQHEEDKTWECFVKMPTRRALVNTLRAMSSFRQTSSFSQNDTSLLLYDFVARKETLKKDPDLLSISSDEAFSDSGLSAISDDRSDYSYIWSEELSDIMSDDSFGTEEKSRFQAPMMLSMKNRTPKPAVSEKEKLREGSTTSSKKGDDSRGPAVPHKPRSPESSRSRHSPARDRSRLSHDDSQQRRRSSQSSHTKRTRSPSTRDKRRSISPPARRRGRSPSPHRRHLTRRSRSRSPRHPRVRRSRSPVHLSRARRSRSSSPEGRVRHRRGRFRNPLGYARDHRHQGNTSPISSSSSRSGRLRGSPTPPKYAAPMGAFKKTPVSAPAHPPPSFPGQSWPPSSIGAPLHPPGVPLPYNPLQPPVMAPPYMPLQPPVPGYPPPPVPKPLLPSNDRMLMEATDIQAMAKEALRSLGVGKGEPARSSSSHADPGTRRRSRSPLPQPSRRLSPDRYHRPPPRGSRSPPARRPNLSRSRSRSRERDVGGRLGRGQGREDRSPPKDIVAIVRKVVQSMLGEEVMRSRNQDDLDKVKSLTRRVLANMGAEEEPRARRESQDWSPRRTGSLERPDLMQPSHKRPLETPGRSDDYEREAERHIEASMQRERMQDRYEPWERPQQGTGMLPDSQRQRQSWENAPSKSRPYSPLSPDVPNREASPRRDYRHGFQQEDPFGRAPPSFPSRPEDPYLRAPKRSENPQQLGRKPSPPAPGFDSYSSTHIPGVSPQKPIKGILKKSRLPEEETSRPSSATSSDVWGSGGGDARSSAPGTYADRHREAPVPQGYDSQPAQKQPQHPQQSYTQTRGYDASRTWEDKGPKVFDYGHHGQSREPERPQDSFQDQPRQAAALDSDAMGKLKVEPLSRKDLERICDIETFIKMQQDDNKIFPYKKEFQSSNFRSFSSKIELFELFGVMCIKVLPNPVPVGWTPMEQIIVPRALRPLFMKLAHETPEGHLPHYKTMDRISSNFTWPSVSPDVASHVVNCTHCSEMNKAGQSAMSSSTRLLLDMHGGRHGASETSSQPATRGRPGQHKTPVQDSSYSSWFGSQSTEQSAQESTSRGGQSGMPQPMTRMEILRHCRLEQLSLWQKADSQLLAMTAQAVQPQTPCTQPDFTMANGVLFRRVPSSATQPATLKVVVPGRLRSSFLSDAHQTKDGQHWGFEIMTSVIGANYYWPTIWEDAQEVVNSCPLCNCSRRF